MQPAIQRPGAKVQAKIATTGPRRRRNVVSVTGAHENGCAAPVLSLHSHDHSIALGYFVKSFVSDHLAIESQVIIRHPRR